MGPVLTPDDMRPPLRDLLDAYQLAWLNVAAAHDRERDVVAALHAAQAVTETAAKAVMVAQSALLAHARGES